MNPADPQDEFVRRLEEAGAVRATDVRARAGVQAMWLEYLLGTCPACLATMALGGEGKTSCKGCGKWLRFVRDG